MSYSSPTGGPALKGSLGNPRALGAWALVGFVGLFLFFEFLRWLFGDGTFSARSEAADFRDLVVIAMPLIAVLFATYVTPEVPFARLISLVAMLEYLAILFFGLITLLIGLGHGFDNANTFSENLNVVRYLLLGLAALVLAAIASYVTFRAYTKLGGRLPSMPS